MVCRNCKIDKPFEEFKPKNRQCKNCALLKRRIKSGQVSREEDYANRRVNLCKRLETGLKICSRCKKEKVFADFGKCYDKNHKDGCKPNCKDCDKKDYQKRKRPDKVLAVLICGGCSLTFKQKTTRAKYCSRACKNKAYQKRIGTDEEYRNKRKMGQKYDKNGNLRIYPEVVFRRRANSKKRKYKQKGLVEGLRELLKIMAAPKTKAKK